MGFFRVILRQLWLWEAEVERGRCLLPYPSAYFLKHLGFPELISVVQERRTVAQERRPRDPASVEMILGAQYTGWNSRSGEISKTCV